MPYFKLRKSFALLPALLALLAFSFPVSAEDARLADGEMKLWRGEVHAHTSESDGVGSVADAYTYARDKAKLDFFAVTDHSDSISEKTYLDLHIPTANSFNEDGKFVALYGYEQTYNISTGYYGHLNSINSPILTKRVTRLGEYYEKMHETNSAIVMFNHPGYSWGNFLEYGLWSEEADKTVCLSEIKGSGYDAEYALALSKGWHISPMYNEDNHSANWGAATEAVGYALAPSLTRENILEAFRLNRTYTTTDGTLKVYYQINGEWMGARLQNPDELHVRAELSTEKAGGLGTIQLISEDNIIVHSISTTDKSYTLDLTLEPEFDYYYIKVNGSNGWCVTAPIWVEGRDKITVTDLEQGLQINNDSNRDYTLTATIRNDSDAPLEEVTVNFYRSQPGSIARKSSPTATVSLGTLAPGESAEASADFRYHLTLRRLTAIVTAKQDGKIYTDTLYTQLSPLYITEMVVITTPKQKVANPYPYIELYNNSDKPLSLNGHSIRVWPRAGAKSDDLAKKTINLSGTIAPHSTMVVWLKPQTSSLTAADFNSHYGCALREGENLLILDQKVVPPTSLGVQVELMQGSTSLGRVWYNWGNIKGVDIRGNRALVYRYQSEFTTTSILEKPHEIPTPGVIENWQVPSVNADTAIAEPAA